MSKSFDSEPPWPEMNEEQKVIASVRARLNWAVHDPDPGERRAMVSYFYELGFEAGLSVQKLNELYEEVLSRMLRPREITDEIVYKETRLGEKVQIWPFPLSAADEHGIPPMAPWTERNRPE